jgi:hypothetical protein
VLIRHEQHEICGYSFNQKKDISFAGGHRVRVFRAEGNVHWRIPQGVQLDISRVTPPRRMPRR